MFETQGLRADHAEECRYAINEEDGDWSEAHRRAQQLASAPGGARNLSSVVSVKGKAAAPVVAEETEVAAAAAGKKRKAEEGGAQKKKKHDAGRRKSGGKK